MSAGHRLVQPSWVAVCFRGLRSGRASACAHRLLQTSAERGGAAWAGECEAAQPWARAFPYAAMAL